MAKQYAVYICDPGASFARDRYTPEQLVEKCRCRHPRHEHWFGGGACGECGGRMDGRGCDYFRPRQGDVVVTGHYTSAERQDTLSKSQRAPSPAWMPLSATPCKEAGA